jgi:hypothetical protein
MRCLTTSRDMSLPPSTEPARRPLSQILSDSGCALVPSFPLAVRFARCHCQGPSEASAAARSCPRFGRVYNSIAARRVAMIENSGTLRQALSQSLQRSTALTLPRFAPCSPNAIGGT